SFSLMISNVTLAFAMPLKVENMVLNSETTGILLSTYGIIALFVFLTPLNKMYDRFSPVSLVVTGIGFIGLVHILLNLTTTYWIMIGLMVIYGRSEEHTSELQSRFDLVCRLLLEKKNR